MIYFLYCETGHVKIGSSKYGIKSRLKSLQCGCPFELKLLREIDGSNVIERVIHDKFKKYRTRGEWFEFNDDIANFISKPDMEILFCDFPYTELAKFRKLNGKTQKRCANEIGITQQKYMAIEKGKQKPSRILADRIIEWSGKKITYSELWDWDK